MRKFKTVIALVLALVLILSCVGNAFAAKKTETGDLEMTEKSKIEAKTLGGFKSESFKELNEYQYADEEVVRAIVVLESKPLADISGDQATRSSYATRLANEHAAVRRAMSGIRYTLAYDFNTVLNGFSCDVAYGDLEAISEIDGVDAVYIANVYKAPTLMPSTIGSGIMTGNSIANYNGIRGEGTVIAVLDTGTLVTHEAFEVYDEAYFDDAALTEDDVVHAVANGKYVSAKIPFAYDYADKDADVTDHDGHGTHVAGTALGYVEEEDGAITFSGASPMAQLLAMKIFSDTNRTTSSDIYFYALEDAYRLGADVVNMSIGSQNGFTYDQVLESEIFGNIYKRMEAAGIVMCVAAGNEYSMAEYSTQGYIGSEYADYGTVASPSTYEGNVSIASVENIAYPQYTITVGGQQIPYSDSSDDSLWRSTFAVADETTGQIVPVEYVIITGEDGSISLGGASDYEGVDVTGKIAVVSRGESSFQEKVDAAAAAGAKGCIVVNNLPGTISMAIDFYMIPAISVQQSALEILQNAEDKTAVTGEELTMISSDSGYLMSDFSNWGTSPNLTIDPTATSVGGNVYSAVNTGDGDYDVYSGTSMASPNAAGTFANVLQYLKERYPEMDKVERANTAKALLESTAEILYDADDFIYSVRKQGAGLLNSEYAISTLYESAYISNPIQELGDDADKTGVYSFEVELVNQGQAGCFYYQPEAVVMFDYAYNGGSTDEPIYANSLTSDYLDDSAITYTIDGADASSGFWINVGEKKTVTVTITLSDAAKAELDEVFPNGTFIEGYVEFYDTDNSDVIAGESNPFVYYVTHATFLAFYGDWTQGEVLEAADFRDYAEAEYWLYTTAADDEGNSYADLGYTPYDLINVVTDINTAYIVNSSLMRAMEYAGNNLVDYAPYNEKHIAFTTELTDASYYYTDLLYMLPYQLRNASHLIMTVSDKETGEVYYVDDTEYLPKAAFNEDAGVWETYSQFQWDGTDAYGDYVPSGTVAHVQFDAVLPYNDTEVEDCWSFDVTVDYTAPTLDSIVYDKEKQTLTVTATDDEYLAAIYLCDYDYTILDSVVYSSDTKGESFTAVFDVSELDVEKLLVTALDYATNEIEEETFFFDVGQDAIITLVTPTGETEIALKTGDTYTFTECADPTVEDTQFLAWCTNPVEKADDITLWEQVGSMYFAEDEILVTEDATFYALYAVGELVPLDKANYYYTHPSASENMTGDWAIVGWNYASGYDTQNPIALDSNGEELTVKELADAEIGDYYIEFFTDDPSVRLSFTKQADGAYSIENVDGKYLANSDGEIAFVDTLTDIALWNVTPDRSNGVHCFNVADENIVLLYDDEEGAFGLYDNTEAFFELLGETYYPTDWFQLIVYKCMTEELEIEYYSTKPTGVQPPAPDCYFEKFTDCTSKWYHEAVDFMASEGFMEGVGGNLFAPDGTMTRAMMVTVLYRIANEPEVKAPSSFKDVDEGKWYSDAIAWAQQNEIILGVTTELFEPFSAVTREQIATILWRYAGSPEVEADFSGLTDAADISVYAKDAMAWAVKEGIFQGNEKKELNPGDAATRAEFAVIMTRYLDGSYACAKLN